MTYMNTTIQTAQVLKSRIAAAGTTRVTVYTPGPGDGKSGVKTFTITIGNKLFYLPALIS